MARKLQVHKATLAGTRFGMLTTLEDSTHSLMQILCRCDCGTIKRVRLYHLKAKRNDKTRATLSCGCLLYTVHLKHGMNKRSETTPEEYGIWSSMRTRCYNTKRNSYKDYGARGIKVCERWNDFAAFYADMGPRPSPEHTLDRIDNDGDYEPSNCRWATPEQQNYNKRNTRYIEFEGLKLTLAKWSDRLGIPTGVLSWRLHSGWTEHKALTTPWKPSPSHRAAWARRKAMLASQTKAKAA